MEGNIWFESIKLLWWMYKGICSLGVHKVVVCRFKDQSTISTFGLVKWLICLPVQSHDNTDNEFYSVQDIEVDGGDSRHKTQEQ